MEYVDVVDESDTIVRVVSKDQAHAEGLLHRTVIAEVIGSDGRWTLVKQADDRQDPGQYVSPIGGHVVSGETAEEALMREAHEEYGLTGKLSYKLIGKKIYNRQVNGKKENHLFIVYEIYTDAAAVLNAESVGTKAFTVKELRKEYFEDPTRFGGAFHFVAKELYSHLFFR